MITENMKITICYRLMKILFKVGEYYDKLGTHK